MELGSSCFNTQRHWQNPKDTQVFGWMPILLTRMPLRCMTGLDILPSGKSNSRFESIHISVSKRFL